MLSFSRKKKIRIKIRIVDEISTIELHNGSDSDHEKNEVGKKK